MTSSRPTRRMGRPRGPSADQAVRRTQLLEAGIRAVRRHGPDVSMEQVAAEAGVTRPILYQHFGDRAGLAEAIIRRFVDGVTERISGAFTDGADRAAVRTLISTFVDLVAEDPDVYRFVVRESSKAAATGADRAEEMVPRLLGFEEISASLSFVLAEELRAGGSDPAVAEAVAEAVAFADMGLVLAACEWWLSRRSMAGDELVELITRLVWAGLVEVGAGAHDGDPPVLEGSPPFLGPSATLSAPDGPRTGDPDGDAPFSDRRQR